MRILTPSEVLLIAGGSDSATVTGWQPGDPTAFFPPNPSSGGGGGGGSAPGVNMQDKSPDPTIDMTNMIIHPVSFDGVHIVNMLIDTKTAPFGSDAYLKAMNAITELGVNYAKLTPAAQSALAHIENIAFIDINRSFSIEKTNTFYYDVSELVRSTSQYAASNILHDAVHISIYDATGSLNQSRGLNAEVAGWQMQVDNASALGLSSTEVSFLQNLIAHPELAVPRVNQPPF